LIRAGHVAPGEVDERSISDVRPDDLAGFAQCHFFAGISVWSYALRLAGWSDDRRVFTGSCPCQPFSGAGGRAGFADERHLWPHWFQLIAQCRPDVIFGEQVASKDGLGWLDVVLADLEAADYAVGAVDLCAAGVGAPHIRQRLWFVADAQRPGLQARPEGDVRGALGHDEGGLAGESGQRSVWSDCDWIPCRDGKLRPVEPGTFPLVDGAPARVVRLRAYGNAIVAPCAAAFISSYLDAVTQ
jgi:DNA (cytosine-5)-methyltransferase 1